MAIVSMKKLSLLGLKSEQEKILKALHYTNCVEITPPKEIEGTEKVFDEKRQEELSATYDKIEFTISYVEDKINERAALSKKSGDDFKKPKKPLFFYRREVSFDEFMLIAGDEIELSAVMNKVEKLKNIISENKTERVRLNNQIEQLKLYSGLNFSFSEVKSTKNMKLFLGIVPSNSLNRFYFGELPAYVQSLKQMPQGDIMFLMCLKQDSAQVQAHLSDCNFSICPYEFSATADEEILNLQERIQALDEQDCECILGVTECASKLDALKLLSDYYKLKLDKYNAEKDFCKTDSTFVLQAYVPVGFEDAVSQAVSLETQNCLLFFDNPSEEDEVPTLTKNAKLVAPYESVTNLYSAPRAQEKDPNLFVGMFFFLFFGLMLSDAGYGIVLTVITLILMKAFKMETGMKKMVLILCMGGVSTIIWGAVFGTWFGADAADIPILKHLMWFNPLKDPMTMLFLCLFLGVVQILFGMGIKASVLIKDKQIFAAVFDIGSWYIFFVGVGALILGIVFNFTINVGLIIIGVSLLLIICTAGRHKKGIFGKIFGGLGGLYNIVNLMSDILSYARLFGLGVATGVIGMTMNLMANMLFGAWYTIPFGIAVLVGGHLFNLSINMLGAYIHNCRLQFIEFFGKFYEGGGYEFTPLGANTRYVKIK